MAIKQKVVCHLKNKDKAKVQKKKRELLKDLFKKNIGNWKKSPLKQPSPHSYRKSIA